MQQTRQFIDARDQLLLLREDHDRACDLFRWPRFEHFNWVHDYFDIMARDNHRPALRWVDDLGKETSLTFAQMSARGHQVANYLSACGVEPGDRLLVMLGNVVPLWEIMLGIMALRAVAIPTATLLTSDDLEDRLQRGRVNAIVTDAGLVPRFAATRGASVQIAINGAPPGWRSYEESGQASADFSQAGLTRADDPLLLYFTSGTTASAKLVVHTHQSYPVGHLSTLYWIGIKPGDVHLNLSSPGWAKHAWSCLFAPWAAGATVLTYHYERFSARALLDQLVRCEVTTFCAPPTVWRMLIQEDLKQWAVTLREVVGAGEPLNPEVIARVREAWGLTIRDGFGQTETTAVVGNPPGQRVKPGSMGRALPGYSVVLAAVDGTRGDEGEICVDLASSPTGLMQGYLDDPQRTAEALRDGLFHTGDVAQRDADGYLTYVGRMDDVFKSSDYRISPFELESVLIEHAAVAEAAVVPSPDPLRLSVPKAFIVLAPGVLPDAVTAQAIFEHIRARMSPFKRVRRIQFDELPKTISGKIRRVELRRAEQDRAIDSLRNRDEFWEEDFPELHAFIAG